MSGERDPDFGAIPYGRFRAYLQPVAARVTREIIHEIQRGVPAYAKPLEGKFGHVLVTGVEQAVRQVIDSIGKRDVDTTQWEEWFRYTGKIEFIEGRSMDALQSAVRIGTRVGWRHLRAAGVALNLPSDTVFAFADALFRYSDELCAVAIAGYTEAQAKASGTIERRRQQLLKVLLAAEPSAPLTLTELAAAAKWELPERVAVVALEYRKDQHRRPDMSLGCDVLIDLESTEPCLLMADPQPHLDAVAKELDGRKAAVGPLVPVADTHRSLAVARRALDLAQRGLLPGPDILHCAEHLTTLALCADEFLLGQLTSTTLAPFDSLTAKQRERLSETLLAWLGARGGINEIATKLGVHPQTVRYRLNQISELLGERLDDADERLKLEIALRARLIGFPASADNGGP